MRPLSAMAGTTGAGHARAKFVVVCRIRVTVFSALPAVTAARYCVSRRARPLSKLGTPERCPIRMIRSTPSAPYRRKHAARLHVERADFEMRRAKILAIAPRIDKAVRRNRHRAADLHQRTEPVDAICRRSSYVEARHAAKRQVACHRKLVWRRPGVHRNAVAPVRRDAAAYFKAGIVA